MTFFLLSHTLELPLNHDTIILFSFFFILVVKLSWSPCSYIVKDNLMTCLSYVTKLK